MLVLGYFQKEDRFYEEALRWDGGEAHANGPAVQLRGEFQIG